MFSLVGTSGTLPTAAPVNYGPEYIIRHYGGKCIDVKTSTYPNTLYLTSKCTKRFYLTKNNKLMDVDQKRCFSNKIRGRKSLLMATSCDQQGTEYQVTRFSSIKQTSSGKCILPSGWFSWFPRERTDLVLDNDCKGRSLFFSFEASKMLHYTCT